jgi:hypothetical protein
MSAGYKGEKHDNFEKLEKTKATSEGGFQKLWKSF